MQHYGDERTRRDPQDNTTIRVATYNINSFPRVGSIKSIRLEQEITDTECIGLSELNRNWFKVNTQDSFRKRIQKWWRMEKTIMTWLREFEWPSEYQQGGTSLSLTGPFSSYGQDKGEDMSGLGRWVWQTIEGHSIIRTVIIQVYRPVRNETDNGSTYRQQQAASDEPNPIKTFDKDILKLIDTFIEDNFQIIIMGDFNINLNGRSQIEQELRARGIEDVIQARYGRENAPNSHKRGSHVIDGIFASETLEMIKGGYDKGMDEISDHRLAWADFTLDTLLGIDRGELVRPRGKKLQITNKARSKRFNKIFRTQMRHHRILHKARKLKQTIGTKTYMTEEQERIYETIDEQRGRAVSNAEENCVRLPSNDKAFSAEFARITGTAIIWKEIAKRIHRGQRIHTRWIMKMKERWKITDHFEIPSTRAEANTQSKDAYNNYKSAQKRTPELRSQFLDLLIRESEDKGNKKKTKDLRAIKEREQTRDVHSRIKYAQGKLRGGGVRFVHRIADNGTVETIKNKLDMEQEIMKANEAKLHSANESPLRQGELAEIITDNDYEQWERFLRGELNLPDNIEEGTRRWLEKFEGKEIEEINIELTDKTYTQSWNRVKEHTSCAPGALHYGTFKAMRWCSEAAELHTIMAQIPIQTGYTPERWKMSVDSMLPKKEGEWRPNKLRLTSLLMPDFNHNNKILGRRAMWRAEEKKLLAPEQYGSRKKLSAAKHALNKRLMLDILRQQRRPGVLCANDAKACYDRILHFAAYISMRRAGLKKEAVKSMLEPIRKLNHVIRTAYGDSNCTYGGEDWERDPSGICQGNGAGPAIWALVSSPLLDMLRDAGYGAKLHSAIGEQLLHLSGFAFVDDADTIQSGTLGEDTEDVLAKAQAELDLWESGIRSTGGGIEGEKSDFAIINYTWNHGIWQYEKRNEANTLTVRDQEGGRNPLKQLKVNEARRTLGVWQAADGNERMQTAKMKEKANKWSRAVARSTLSRNDTIIGIKTTLYPSVTFGMMATCLTQEQCEEAFKPIRAGALSKAGYVKSIPAVVLHGPEKYGGIGLKDFHSVQHIEHIKALSDEGGKTSPTGQLLEILLHGHVLEIGRSGSFLEQKYNEVGPTLTQSWLKDTLQYISHHGITIHGKHNHLQTWRQRDSLIMDDINNTPGTTTSDMELTAANRCRMYLKATTKSDISTGDGKGIINSAWNCFRDWNTLSSRAYKWPRQPRPSQNDIHAWQRVLATTYGIDQRNRRWTTHMGHWTQKSRRHITWVFDRMNDSLYKRNGRTWERWSKQIRRTRTRQYQATGEIHDSALSRWENAQVTLPTGHTAFYEGSATTHQQQHNIITVGPTLAMETTRPTLIQKIRNVEPSMKWALEDLEIPADNGLEIATAIIQNRGECMSDGSLKNGLGTSAAVFMGTEEDNMYTIKNRVPGATEDQSSYRSELCGILAGVLMVNIIASTHDIQEGTITIGCDNESAIGKAFGTEHTDTGDNSFDIIRVIHHAIKQTHIKWIPKHVPAHQDDDKTARLDRWGLANVKADKLAEEYWTQQYSAGERHRPTPTVMPGEGWRISIEGRPLTKNVDRQIYEHTYYDRCMRYWSKKGRILPAMGKFVDWTRYHGAIKLMPRGRRQWVHKHFCGFEGTNYMLEKWQRRTNPMCPRCDQIETHRHIVRCQSNDATQAYRGIHRNFESWLYATTSSGIREAILAHLHAYREEEQVEEGDTWSPQLKQASMMQSALGACAFMEGCLCRHWEPIQKTYLDATYSKKSASRWIKELIIKLWLISWDMWDYRNGLVHDDAQVRTEQLIAQLNADITEKHETGQTNRFLPRIEKRFFRGSLDAILRTTEYQKRTWLHIATRFIERDRQRVAQSRSIQIMREFLAPGSTAAIMRNRTRIINRATTDVRAPRGTRRGPAGTID